MHCLLRADGKRPCRRAANYFYEIAPPHCGPRSSDRAWHRGKFSTPSGSWCKFPMSDLGQKRTCAVQLLRPRGLVHDDARPDFAIQQPLEVEAGNLTISSFTNMRCEVGDGAVIARFQFGKCLEITLR